MTILRSVLCGVAAMLLTTLAYGEPAEIIQAALQDFLDQPNYTWGVANTRGLPEADGEDTEQAFGGQHEKGGYTKVNFRRGPHIPPDDTPAAKPWPGFMDRDDSVSDRWVFWTPEGWKLLGQLPITRPRVASSAPAPSGVKLGSLSIGRTIGFRKIGFRRPDHEIAIMLPFLGEVAEVRPGIYQAKLDQQGATRLLAIPRPVSGIFPSPGAENASAEATFWVREGKLTRYEITYDGIWTFLGRRVPVHRVVIRDLRDLGTTVIDVPVEVRRMLGEEVSAAP